MSEAAANKLETKKRVGLDLVMLGAWLSTGLIALVFFAFVVPSCGQAFIRADVALAAPTRTVFGVSQFLVRYWWMIAPVAMAISLVPLCLRLGRSWPIYLVATGLMLLLTMGSAVSIFVPMRDLQQMEAEGK